jgi:hypothetical protein
MVAGFWLNQDGLPLQFGTQKAIPEVGGDYLVYGETREIEQLIPLVPMAMGTGGIQVPAPPTSFSGTSTPIAAGIQSLTDIIPLQITPVTTVSGGVLTFTTNQLFFEQIEVDTIVGATGGTSISVGLACVNPAAGPAAYVQVTPNAGVQLVNGLLIANMATSGQKAIFTQPGSTGLLLSSPGSAIAGGGSWLGSVPLVTNALTPLPSKAYISTIATGTFTSGLIKLRLRYTMYGNISN